VDAETFEKRIAELETTLEELQGAERRKEAEAAGIDLDAEIGRLKDELRRLMTTRYARLTPWEKTQTARHKNRPYTLDYLRIAFDGFVELSGDRLGHNDEAVVGGLARLDGMPVVVAGHQKARDAKERVRRNFGMARGPGYRKALRLAKLAEKFRIPLITLVDTAGAAADLKAEETGISEAIARNLMEMSVLETPIIAVIIGEGGSGGALGLGVADIVMMLEHSVYSVISPEGCASILWHDRERAAEAAECLKLTAQHALEAGIIDEIVPEPLGGAHRDHGAAAAALKSALIPHIHALKKRKSSDLLKERYARLRALGRWEENPSV
jgi:acetyl-CoA carboxylase carboxyl transferase subunit alpha